MNKGTNRGWWWCGVDFDGSRRYGGGCDDGEVWLHRCGLPFSVASLNAVSILAYYICT